MTGRRNRIPSDSFPLPGADDLWRRISATVEGFKADQVDGFVSVKLNFTHGKYDGYSLQVGEHESGLARFSLDTQSVVVLGSLSTTSS